MDIPKDYLNTLKKRAWPLKLTSERQELIQRFVDKINRERIGTTFKPATWRQINGLLAFFKLPDLHWLLRECERGESFSKVFFGILKRTRI